MDTRQLHFANSAISIEFEAGPAGYLVNYLFGAIAESGPATPHVTLRLVREPGTERWSLLQDGVVELRDALAAPLAVHLMDRAGYHLVDRSQGGLLLHAACLHRDGWAYLLPGATGSGKSSLALWLAQRGFEYMTDELVFIPAGSLECQAFSRPVYLKRAGRELFPQLLEKLRREVDLLSFPGGDLLPPELVGTGEVRSSARLGCIVMPRYQSGAELHFQSLSIARTAVALTRCLINARNLPENGFPELVRISQVAPVFELAYGSFSQLGELFEKLTPGK